MSSVMVMWRAMKQQEEQKRVIRARRTQARTLTGGCVLLQSRRSKASNQYGV